MRRFSVIGRSGGGAGALACAATLGNRPKQNVPKLDRVVTLATTVPPEAEKELNLFEGLGEANAADARLGEMALIAEVTDRATKLQTDPWYLIREKISGDFTAADFRAARYGTGARIAVSQSWATRRPGGYIDDTLAASRPWEIELESITVPVHMWAAGADPFCPATYAQWLAKRIRGAGVSIDRAGASHFTAMELMPFLHGCFGDIAQDHARSMGRRVVRHVPSSVFS